MQRKLGNHQNKIIQFEYGGTNFDSTHIETMNFELVDMNIHEIYQRYAYDLLEETSARKRTKHLNLIYESSTLKRFKEQIKELKNWIQNGWRRSHTATDEQKHTKYLTLLVVQDLLLICLLMIIIFMWQQITNYTSTIKILRYISKHLRYFCLVCCLNS